MKKDLYEVLKENSVDAHNILGQWEVVNVATDDKPHRCLCGKENIIEVATIFNRKTNKTLFPIGNQCIRNFKNDTFDEEYYFHKYGRAIYDIYKANKEVSISRFSRRFIEMLDEKQFLYRDWWNNYEGDYDFLINYFNKRNTTPKQDYRFKMVLKHKIIPELGHLYENDK